MEVARANEHRRSASALAAQLNRSPNVKLLGLSLLSMVSFTSVSAFWVPRSLDELVFDADVVVVAYFERTSVEDGPDSAFHFGQFHLDHEIKGRISDSFRVLGTEIEWCGPNTNFQNLKPGRYLLFLSQRDDAWIAEDGCIILIEGGYVWWRKTEEAHWSKRRLRSVERHIRSVLKPKRRTTHRSQRGAGAPRG